MSTEHCKMGGQEKAVKTKFTEIKLCPFWVL